jgi:hypothetical protein
VFIPFRPFCFFQQKQHLSLTAKSSKARLERSNPVLLACAGLGKPVVVEAIAAAAAPLWQGQVFFKTPSGVPKTVCVDSNTLVAQLKDLIRNSTGALMELLAPLRVLARLNR